MKNLTNLCLLLIVSILFACEGEQKKEDHAGHDHATEMTTTTDTTVSHEANDNVSADGTQKLLAGYFEIKDALVKTEPETASKKALAFVKVLEANDAGQLFASTRAIASAKDVKEQRKQFEVLSQQMYMLVKNNKTDGATVYKQFCPMAFDNKGAFWLAKEKEINNPYFGDKMLHCGMVQEEL
ncbi:DUF3347 domain-containing protein [Persicobacter psychrovividus]|uniref:DUF3347 domain-containing protein n=1 Tax=Persicobacter psychrovividus TaxID=387638 RepID=A0ABM7VIY5_9BACT|nr:hypothetical protein PEPS_32380 [Persicobacter psychrovividus]